MKLLIIIIGFIILNSYATDVCSIRIDIADFQYIGDVISEYPHAFDARKLHSETKQMLEEKGYSVLPFSWGVYGQDVGFSLEFNTEKVTGGGVRLKG